MDSEWSLSSRTPREICKNFQFKLFYSGDKQVLFFQTTSLYSSAPGSSFPAQWNLYKLVQGCAARELRTAAWGAWSQPGLQEPTTESRVIVQPAKLRQGALKASLGYITRLYLQNWTTRVRDKTQQFKAHILILQRSQSQFSTPMSSSSQRPITQLQGIKWLLLVSVVITYIKCTDP